MQYYTATTIKAWGLYLHVHVVKLVAKEGYSSTVPLLKSPLYNVLCLALIIANTSFEAAVLETCLGWNYCLHNHSNQRVCHVLGIVTYSFSPSFPPEALYVYTVFSPGKFQGMLAVYGWGMACGHIRFWATSFPTSKKNLYSRLAGLTYHRNWFLNAARC